MPTLQEQGANSPAFRLTGFQCCVAPKATPRRSSAGSPDLVEAGKGQKVQDMMRLYGLDESAMTLEKLQKLYNEEAPIWLDLVKNLNLEPV